MAMPPYPMIHEAAGTRVYNGMARTNQEVNTIIIASTLHRLSEGAGQ